MTVVSRREGSTEHGIYWNCICFCGKMFQATSFDLDTGKRKSCNCLRGVIDGRSKHPLNSLWDNMIRRCTDPKSVSYSNYGGRGITICEKWLDFNGFIEDIPSRPSPKHQLDRIDNSLGYYKANCRWVTPTQNAQNTRTNINLTYDGKTLCINEWARRIGMSGRGLAQRLRRGWSIEKSLTTPTQIRR